MLTYATIFIASVIIAVVAIVFYRVVSSSSNSVLNSKAPVSIVTGSHKSKTHATVTGESVNAGGYNRVATEGLARVTPAVPTENTDWGWQEKGGQVQEQGSHHLAREDATEHCSLYDVDPTAPPQVLKPRLHREDKLEAGGKAYKVTRKTDSRNAPTEDSGKPWGW